KSTLEASARPLFAVGTERFPSDTHLRQSRESPNAQRSPSSPAHDPQPHIRRSCPESTPHLRVDFLSTLFDQTLDALALVAQMLQFAESELLQPRRKCYSH